jgi:amino acid adenylation domain-containing protein
MSLLGLEPRPLSLATDACKASGGAPPSFAQQRLWFVDRLRPGSPAYHLPVALRLTGRLDAAVAERCLREAVHRHEALRTVFRRVGGQLAQVVLPDVPCPLPIEDLSHLPPEGREAEASRRMAVEFRLPFDLERGPLLRAGLLRLAAEDHVLWLSAHHIACDGRSVEVLYQDFAALYAAFLHGEPSPLPPLPAHYADYATAQRARMQGETLREHLTWWKQQLAGLAESLELPTDRPRPVEAALRGGTRFFSLPLGLTEALESLGRSEVTWLFMTLLAGFKALLKRYTGQDDIAVGTPVADRPRREWHKMIGCFLNIAVLRTDLSGDPTFRELLRRLRTRALRAYAHQDLPFERLVEELRPARTRGRQPLIQATFTLQDDPARGMALPGLKAASILAVDSGAAQYDLGLRMTRTEAGLEGALEYDSDLFDAATIDRMVGHFRVLLEAAAAAPDRHLSELPLLSTDENRQLMSWGRPEYKTEAPAREEADGPIPGAADLSTLFEAQVARTPGAIAVTFEGTALTYGELNAWANRLAHRLRGLGVGPGTCVGLFAERSAAMVAGTLGILKAGAAYVPIDTSYPNDRAAFMLSDAAAPVVLTQRGLASRLGGAAAQVLFLEDDASGDDTANPPATAHPASPAYVIYTSGSTGRPKGVVVTHANVVRLFHATDAWMGFGPSDVWTLFHSIAFDFSVWELWGALLYGGRLVVVPYLVSRSPADFYALLTREKVTVLNQTPSAFRELIRADGQIRARDLALRLVIFGGEALDFQGLRPWFERHGDSKPQLVNMYGITETTVHVTYHPVKLGDLGSAASVIGVPIPDLQVYVLDGQRRLCPVGVPGELYVGGAGVACGYLNRPELTAERFVPDPWSDGPSARLYRSGDKARWLADGRLEYLGRLDQQVKVRGFRIETAEVEHHVKQCPGVTDCVVVVREDRPGDRRLVAYFVAAQPAPDAGELRRSLSTKLPTYMVPSAFVPLERLPLTSNGKANRAALPAPALAESGGPRPVVPPRDETEAELAQLWREALGEESVSVTEDFFDSGGNSLLAMGLLARVERAFGRKVSLARFFQAPTIEAVGASLCEETWEGPETRVFPMRGEGAHPPMVLVDAGPFFRPLVRRLGGDQPVFGLSLPETSALPEGYSVSDIAANLVEALCASELPGPYYLAGWSAAGVIAYEVARQLRSRGKEVPLLTLFDSSNPVYWRSFERWWMFPVRAYLWLEKVLYHLRKAWGGPFRQLWPSFMERMKQFCLPSAKGAQENATLKGADEWSWRLQYRTVIDYRPEPCDTPIVLFRSTVLQSGWFRDPQLGWGALARGGLTVHEMSGEHNTMFLEPDVQQLAALWNKCAQQVRATGRCASPGAP